MNSASDVLTALESGWGYKWQWQWLWLFMVLLFIRSDMIHENKITTINIQRNALFVKIISTNRELASRRVPRPHLTGRRGNKIPLSVVYRSAY